MTRWSRLNPRLGPVLALCVLAALALSCSSSEDAATEDAGANGAPDGHVVATFLAPDLDEAGTQALVKALSKDPGILTAAAQPDSGLFRIAFSAEKTTPADVLRAVSTTNPTLALRDIAQVAASADGGACAGCPSQAACGSAGK